MIGLNLPIVLSTFLHHSSPSGVRLMDWPIPFSKFSIIIKYTIWDQYPLIFFLHGSHLLTPPLPHILSANSKIEIISLFYLYNIYLRSMKFRPCGYKPAPSVVSSNSEAIVIFVVVAVNVVDEYHSNLYFSRSLVCFQHFLFHSYYCTVNWTTLTRLDVCIVYVQK